jgi:flagellum-specific ATP synthase
MLSADLSQIRQQLAQLNSWSSSGVVERTEGHLVIANLPGARLGDLCQIIPGRQQPVIQAQVIALAGELVRLMPYQSVDGTRAGDRVYSQSCRMQLPLDPALAGCSLNALGQSLTATPLPLLPASQLPAQAISPLSRAPLQQQFLTGIRALDCFNPLALGQRIGILAGSGVGKSTLLSQLAAAAVRLQQKIVVVLVGERGREVEAFVRLLQHYQLQSRTVLIAATAEEMPVTRVQAVQYGVAVAEMFSQQGEDVLLLVDSMTRLAMAQRDIGLASGEPATAKGYTPSVFSLLQRLIERCGAFRDRGSITGIFTVLVESDDFADPVVDALRAVLDGHLVLDRQLAEQGHYPAIDISRSISRLFDDLATEPQRQLSRQGRQLLAEYRQKRTMLDLAAAEGPLSGQLLQLLQQYQQLQQWLQQTAPAADMLDEQLQQLAALIGGHYA